MKRENKKDLGDKKVDERIGEKLFSSEICKEQKWRNE